MTGWILSRQPDATPELTDLIKIVGGRQVFLRDISRRETCEVDCERPALR